MAKPTNLAFWDGATKVEPTTPQKTTGWTNGDRPPASWFNWWMNLVHLWIAWLDAFESTVHTWSAVQTFSVAPTFTNGAVFSVAPWLVGGATYTSNGLDDISGNYATVQYAQIFRRVCGVGTGPFYLRAYWRTIGSSTGLVVTRNARWDNALPGWVRDDASAEMTRTEFRLGNGVLSWTLPTSLTAGTITDLFWELNATRGIELYDTNSVGFVGAVDSTNRFKQVKYIAQDAPVAPTYASGVIPGIGAGGGSESVTHQKLSTGIVVVRGVAERTSGGIASGVTYFTLPSGSRPGTDMTFQCFDRTSAVWYECRVLTTGAVIVQNLHAQNLNIVFNLEFYAP